MKHRLPVCLLAAVMLLTGCNDTPPVSQALPDDSTPAVTSTASATAATADTTATSTADTIATSTADTIATSTAATPEVTTAATTATTTAATTAATTVPTTAATTAATTAPTTAATTAATTTSKTAAPMPAEPAEDVLLRLEAEDGKLSGGLSVTDIGGCSGGQAVQNFGGDADVILLTADIPQGGMYDITVTAAGIGSYKENGISVDGVPVGTFSSENGVFSGYVIPNVFMEKGRHSISVVRSWGWIQLDCIDITTAGGIDPAVFAVEPTLSDKKATKEAQELFRFLCDSYGEYVISGQVCDDGYFGREMSAIREVTGETPAILGLDMMDYTPSRQALGARSHAVDTALDFADRGGIVTFCWHWNAPTEYLKDGKDDNGNPRWWGGFYTRNTTFDIDAVMNGRDPEGKAALDRDIAEIAAQLLRLQEAGVPVLWRPLHEASGGWFWWGAKGADAYKKLWVYLHGQLTEKYGCHNLIWVFNGQSADWYPGDRYVDIIGEDIYPGERVYSPQTAKFTEAAGYPDDSRIVALTENGCIFDIEQAVMTDTMWAWFCTWGGEFVVSGNSYSEKFTEKDILRKVYSSDRVLTLDELPFG